jgi:predicted acyl esterase
VRRRRIAVLAALASLVVAVPATRAAAPQRITETGYIEVADGTLLNYTVVRPASSDDPAHRTPTLFEYSGYEPGLVPDAGYVARYVPRGYAYIGVNLRGSGCSGGTWDFFSPQEAKDGAEVVEWIARQKWSNGRVAMIGKSYPGITQLFVAAQRPKHLVAIAPGHTYGDIYRDVAYPGGIFNYSFAALWSFVAQPGQSYPHAFERAARGDTTCAQHLATRTAPSVRDNPFVQAQEHPWDDALIKERSPIYLVGRITVPVWTVAAWQDEQVGSKAVDWFPHLRQDLLHGIVTNGDHGMYRTEPAMQQLDAFLDHFVRGVDNGFPSKGPDLRVWWEAGRDGGRRAPGWQTTIAKWPPPQAATWRVRLPDGPPAAYAYAGPTGEGIPNARYSSVVSQPDVYFDQPPPPGTAVDVTTGPLTSDVTALGSASVDLWIASTAPDTDLQVTITEVRPDGQEEFVQQGWLRASHRALDPARSTATQPYQTHQRRDQSLLTPGEPTAVRIEVFPFGHVFRKGSRIRLWVEAPKAVPDLWGFAALPVPAANLVYHDAAHPSSIAFSVLPGVRAPLPRAACDTVIRQPCRAAH